MRGKKLFTISLVVGVILTAVFGGLFIFGLLPQAVVHAQTVQSSDFGLEQVGQGSGFTGTTDVRITIARIIRIALGFLGTVAFLLCLYAGFLWMTAGGNDERIGEAKKILLNAAIGVIIIASAYGLTTFIITQLVAATNGNGSITDTSGLGCTGPDCIGGGGGATGNVFYINSLPSAGNVCVQNVHPALVFNREVDLATVQNALVIQKKNTATDVVGSWQYGTKKSIIAFVPQGACGNGVTTNDCFEPATEYQVQFKNPSAIKSLDNLTLNCSLKAGCKTVDFTSGTGIERTSPRLTVLSPAAHTSFPLGEVVPFTISYTSDSGVQNISLYEGGGLIGSQTVSGCAATGTIQLSWSTIGKSAGSYTLESLATGWSGLQGSVQTPLTLAPLHCFDATLDATLGEIVKGPPACGGECGSCGGDTCKENGQCASGYCELSGSAGVCIDRMRVSDFTPGSGAPGTYVTLSGLYFGTSTGAVYFSKVSNPNPANLNDWVKATLVSCVAGVNSWTPAQILVEVPAGAVTGPLLVVTTPVKGKDGIARTFTDATNDAWGPRLGDFQITTQVRPGLCALKPNEGAAGDTIELFGKNFGFLDTANDQVSFGETKALVAPTNWADATIKTLVPGLSSSVVGVRVTANGVESNALRFVVNGGESATSPLISTVSPEAGAPGEYLTISGKNFGSNIGAVWFKRDAQSEAILGDFDFPDSCQNAVWRDDQIIVKFPLAKGTTGTVYYVQIKTADNKVSSFESAPAFSLKGGTPAPGICKISPNSGPSPFPANETLTLSGEYFGTGPQVYFWKTGANSSSIDGRVKVDASAVVAASDTSVELRAPAGISTGPVLVVRGNDKKVSNPENFQVVDCVKNNNTCPVAGSVCCAAGPEAGLCKPAGELCEGALRSTAYIWRFSTNDIPQIPHVIERCDANVDSGLALPSPSPSTLWSSGAASDDQVNVCRTALVTVEFSTQLDQATVQASSVVLKKCSSVSSTTCVNPTAVTLTPDSFTLQTAASEQGGQIRNYISLAPAVGKLEDNSWYQVSLAKTITSALLEGKAVPLAVDKSCSADSAYCFLFKTGAQDCKIKTVIITPYSYWTSVLEAPIKYRSGQFEKRLDYIGNGLSDQRCILMNVANFAWNWGTSNKTYAEIYGPDTVRSVQASALANTVGVGLSNPDDAVSINATARQGANAYAGKSPLIVDLNNPEVVDYWPRCLEACTIAEVGVRFNTSMSNRNLPGAASGGAVQLLKCLDENCLSTQPVLSTGDVYLDQDSNYTILKIANSRFSSIALEPNTLYQVLISSSSTDPLSSLKQVWSAARLNQPSSYSRPYNTQFAWRFKTKRDSCRIDHVQVNPEEYVAQTIKEQATFAVEPYSSPDSCSPKGQKLNPWLVNWGWSSSDEKVATLNTYSTRGASPACTQACVRRGSELPSSATVTSVCGNGIVEAGEDCETPDKARGCSLDCRFLGSNATSCGNGIVEAEKGEACDPKDTKTQIGCSADCRHVGAAATVSATSINASICGSGTLGSGKDCDRAIAGKISDPSSALLCTAQCLHVGTPISSKWCSDNVLTKGGFSASEYDAACSKSLSQCGNGVQEPEEDPGCDTAAGWNSNQCDQFCLKKKDTQCIPSSEGCSVDGRLIGSSLMYSQPSVCGDGVAGVGEVPYCESSLVANGHQGLIDPWALAIGRGLGTPAGDPPTQRTTITAGTNQNTNGSTVSGKGSFAVACGFTSNQECQAAFGADYGVGANSCCTLRPKLVSVYPKDGATNACPNTYIEAVFDSAIDPQTLKTGVVLARGAVACSSTADDVTDQVAYTELLSSHESLAWYTRAYKRVATLVRHLWGSEVEAVTTHWCLAPDVGTTEVVPAPENGAMASRVRIKLTTALAKNTDYAVIIKDSIKTNTGVSVSGVGGKPISWTFATISQLCELDSVSVTPKEWSFTRVGASTTLTAQGATTNGSFIQGIPGLYDWQYAWSPLSNDSVAVEVATSSLNHISALNRNGEVYVRATAQLTANAISTTTGAVAAGESHVIVLLCENPWPPKDLYLGASGPFTIFPFEDAVGNNDGFDLASNTFNNSAIPASPVTRDGYFNFSTYYCADKGLPGTFDDLPYLRGTVQVAPSIVSPTTSLKRFLFTNSKNNDVIGLQVFPNPSHLTAEEWYSFDKEQGGRGFTGNLQRITVNGFQAVSDGNNVYIDGLNYSDGTKGVYSNIYLLSVNSNATPDTRAVFEQILKNFKLTTNVTNYGYCASPGGAPDFKTACRIDFDCSNGQICSATVDKLKRNYERLRGLNYLKDALAAYAKGHGGTYPTLSEGTYLKGQAISTWPTWDTLGTALGGTAPRDPVNILGKGGTCSQTTNRFCTVNAECPSGETCVVHDAETGWSTADRRFSFACATSSLAYRYISVSSTQFSVRGVWENPGILISNLDSFIKDFVDPTQFILTNPTGICNQDQEISTLNQGRCGDGEVNYSRGELCDPPGKVLYGACSAEQTNKVRVDVCSSDCKYVPSSTPFIACSALSSCGNGRLEAGEQCDEGVLNGTYNHCSKTCSFPPADPPGYCGDGKVQSGFETCDYKAGLSGKNGLCIGGVVPGSGCNVDADCRSSSIGTSQAGTCQLFTAATGRYGLSSTTACGLDCRSAGPRCGDGIVQAIFGEECDGNQQCTVAGVPGTQNCTVDCRIAEPTAVAWWRFDDLIARNLKGTEFMVVRDEVTGDTSSTICLPSSGSSKAICPTLAPDARQGRSLQFDGVNQALFLAANLSASPVQLAALNHTDNVTVEAWIKPTGRGVWPRILEKGGYGKSGGYTFQLDSTGEHASFVVWNTGSKNSFGAIGATSIPLNEWTHVVGVYQTQGSLHTVKIYVNGKLDGVIQKTTTEEVLAPTSGDAFIIFAAGADPQSLFKGQLDEIKIYDKALSDAEIVERSESTWACLAAPTAVVATTPSASCGDGKVDAGEACDRGTQNGQACTPTYNKTCSYCAADCRNVIDVQPKEYCGNTVVESPEICELDPATNLIYAAGQDSATKVTKDATHKGYEVLSCADEPADPFTVKKGTKACAAACSVIQSSCVICGVDTQRGVTVQGGIINVLDPMSTNPLLGVNGQDGRLDLGLSTSATTTLVGHVYWSQNSAANYALHPPSENGYTSTNLVKLGSDSRCSYGDAPTYALTVNDDAAHRIDFPVLPKPNPWQYDLVLSPVINKAQRPQDLRIVLRWVGNKVDFHSGFLHAIETNGQPAAREDLSFAGSNITKRQDYWNGNELGNIWYHGTGFSNNGTNVMSYTLDTSNLYSGRYVFYVRVPQSNPADPGIARYADSSKMAVDVYLPENDTNGRHFGKPTYTYYLTQAQASDNPSAPYWTVLDLLTDRSIQNPQDRVVPIQKITTKPYLPAL